MIDRIFKSWKSTLIGLIVFLIAAIHVYTSDSVDLYSVSGFIATMLLLLIDDKQVGLKG